MDPRSEYLEGAFKALASSTLDDLLSGLTIQRVAGRALRPAKHFNDHWHGGKTELVGSMLTRAAAPPASDGAAVHEAVQRLYRALHDRRDGVLDDVRDVALRNFTEYNERDFAGELMLGFLAILAAPNDPAAREAIAEYYEQQTVQLTGMYDGVLLALGREPISELADGSRTLAVLITALFDGLTLRSRFDDTFDAASAFANAIVPLVLGLTRSCAEPHPVWMERLGGGAGSIRTHRGVEETYEAVISALREIDRSDGASHIDVASLHGHAEHRHLEPSPQALRLREEISGLVARGWSVRRLTTISTPARLAKEEAALQVLDTTHPTPLFEVRAFVTRSLPLLAPMIIGGRIVVLGVEDGASYGVSSAFALREPETVDICTRYFEMLWNDERAIRLRTPAGIRPAGLDAVRQAIDETGAEMDPVEV